VRTRNPNSSRWSPSAGWPQRHRGRRMVRDGRQSRHPQPRR
jgi:hypothetical protein